MAGNGSIGNASADGKDRKHREIDMTQGPIAGPLLRFILPIMGGSIFQQLYNTVDFLFVGNLLNKTAAAAVGASSTLVTLCIGLFSGIAVGTGVIIGQAAGMKGEARVKAALQSSVGFGFLFGIPIMALGILLAPGILRLLNTPDPVIPQAVAYMRIYLLSIPFMIFYNICSGAVRAKGDSETPFRILVVCGFLNVVADALLIIVIPLGVSGVALATLLSQIVSALLILLHLRREDPGFLRGKRPLAIDPSILRSILRIGLPAGIQTMTITFSNVMVQYHINAFGETAVAAFAAYFKVENFIYLPVMAFGQASTAFAAQNTGSGNYPRIRKGLRVILAMSVALALATALVLILNLSTVFTWFIKDPDVVRTAAGIASVTFPFYWLYPLLENTGGMLRGMGQALLSMAVIIFNFCVLRISLLAIFSRIFGTVSALAAVYPLTWAGASLCFLAAWWVYMRRIPKEDKKQEEGV